MWLASEVALFSSLYFTLAMGEAICHIVSCPMERPTGKELMREYPANCQQETEAHGNPLLIPKLGFGDSNPSCVFLKAMLFPLAPTTLLSLVAHHV